MTKPLFWCAFICSAALLSSACQKAPASGGVFPMGERVPVGQVTYSVVDSAWKTKLGESFKARSPEQRFLLLTISIVNGTGHDISIPLLTLEGPDGQTYRELSNGDGVDNWLGLLRTISPGQTEQGRVLFDVPLTSYRLRVPDVADPGLEKYVKVDIPLRLDSEVPIQSPIAPESLK
jgi:hypothetical protein